MIKADKGVVQLQGNNALLFSELSCIARALYEVTKEEEKSAAELLIRQVVALGLDDAKKDGKPDANPRTVSNKEPKSILTDLINKVFGEDKKDE